MQNNMLVWTIRKVELGDASGGSIDYALRNRAGDERKSLKCA